MKLSEVNWEKELIAFQKPGRYLGTEHNGYISKSRKYKFLLCFPDDYTIGMSSLGYHTVGNIVHNFSPFDCERCFAPAPDMEKWMRDNGIELFSLETKSRAGEFDILGFSIHYQLSYTNLINMIDLAGMEVFREKRGENDPVLIGGGPCCSNPDILGEFLDLIIVGEAEEDLLKVLNEYPASRSREEFLRKASCFESVYVPGIKENAKIAVYRNLDNKYYPCCPPVPLVEVPHNRLNIEINRGCRNSCRFCQASAVYFPYREKSVKDIVSIAGESILNTGYDEISLTSLSATDHPKLIDIMDELYYSFRDLGVSVVMSSMRPSNFQGKLSDRMARLRKGGLTFAPETPSEKLKKVINKHIKNEEIIDAARKAAQMGWKKIKLYFMIGLPEETREDVEEIPSFIEKVRKESGLQISATVSPMIPQPHTPFEWINNVDTDVLSERAAFVKRNSRAKVNVFEVKRHILESIFVRADRTLAKVVFSAWKKGARFDQWGEYFNFTIWEEAFKENGFEWKDFYYRDFENQKEFVWRSVETQIKKDYLTSFRKRVKNEQKTG